MDKILHRFGFIVLVFSMYSGHAIAQPNDSHVKVDPSPHFNKAVAKQSVKKTKPVVASRASGKVSRKSGAKGTVIITSASVSRTTALYPAKVLRLQGRVEVVARRGVALAQAERLYKGAILNLGDVIQTYQQSFVSLRLGGGSISTLPSSSKVELARSSKNVARFILHKGMVESRVNHNHVPSKNNVFEIQIPNAIVGVRGTQFRVHHDQNKSSAEVNEGVVWVKSRQVCALPLILKTGQGARIEGFAPSQERTSQLLPKPVLLNQDEAQKDDVIAFNVSAIEGANQYHAQIATDESFIDIYAETYGTTPKLDFRQKDLNNGFYFVRLSAIDFAGIEGSSSVYVFLRAKK